MMLASKASAFSAVWRFKRRVAPKTGNIAGKPIGRRLVRWCFGPVVPMMILVAIPNPVLTEEATAWSLPRLVRYALKNNKGYEADRIGAQITNQDIAIARGQRWPRLEAQGSFSYFPIRERLLIERHGFRPTPVNPGDNPFQEKIFNYGLQVTLPLYTSGRIYHEISAAKAAAAASRIRVTASRQELIFNVMSVYYTLLRVRANLGASEGLVRSVGESRRIAVQKAKVGKAARLRVLRLETALARAESRLAAAKGNFAATLATLKALLGLPRETSMAVEGSSVPARSVQDVKDAHGTALGTRPDLIALRREIEAQEHRLGIARSRQGPSLDATMFYGAASGEDETTDDAKIFLKLRLPIFTGGVLSSKKRKALLRLKQLKARLAGAERRVIVEVDRNLIRLSANAARVSAGARAVTQAVEALRVERQKFDVGRGTTNDLLIAEEALLRAKIDHAAAVSDGQIAYAALLLSMGELDVPTK